MRPRQAQVLNTILRYQREHNKPPTYREIGRAVGARSTSTVSRDIRQLRRWGYIAPSEDSSYRALRVLKPPYELIYRIENGEMILHPLGLERMRGNWTD